MLFSFKPGKTTQIAITCTCLQAFFLFGYDQGVFGGLVTNNDFLDAMNNPNEALLGIIVSIYNIGCLVGCLMNFAVGNRFGRRQAIWFSMAVLCVGAIIQMVSYSVPQMMVGRIITGIGVGIDTSTVPTYQSELCEGSRRGRLVTTEVLFTAVGVAFAYFFSFGMSYVGGAIAWRFPIALQMIFAIPVVIMIFALPESPRWLIQKGRHEDAMNAMTQTFGLDEQDDWVQEEKSSIMKAVALERESEFKWIQIFKKDPLCTGWRVFLACLVLTMNQWAGINVVVFYASVVLEDNVGLERQTALVVGGCLNLAFAVGSLVPSLGLDKLGRRRPMMGGAFGMAMSMMIIAILLSFKDSENGPAMASASIAFFITFMISFGTSLNAIPWCYSAEILPLHIRSQGASLAVCANWVSVFIIVMVTPTMVANLQWKTYLIFMATNISFIPVIYFLFPETKGRSLEDIDLIFLKEERRASMVGDSYVAGLSAEKHNAIEQREV